MFSSVIFLTLMAFSKVAHFSVTNYTKIHQNLTENMIRLQDGGSAVEDSDILKFINPDQKGFSSVPLPLELLIRILDYVDIKDISAYSSTCTGARKIFHLFVAEKLRRINKHFVSINTESNLLQYLFMLKNDLFKRPYPENYSQNGFHVIKSIPERVNFHLQAFYLIARFKSMNKYELIEELDTLLDHHFSSTKADEVTSSSALDRIFLLRATMLDKSSVYDCFFNPEVLDAFASGTIFTIRHFNRLLFDSLDAHKKDSLLHTLHSNHFNQGFKNLDEFFGYEVLVPGRREFQGELVKTLKAFNQNSENVSETLLFLLINYKFVDEHLLPFSRTLFWFAFHRYRDNIFTAFSAKNLIFSWSFSYSLAADFVLTFPHFAKNLFSILGVNDLNDLKRLVVYKELPVPISDYNEVLTAAAHFGHLRTVKLINEFFQLNNSNYEDALISASRTEYPQTVQFLLQKLDPKLSLDCIKTSIKNAVSINRVQTLKILLEYFRSHYHPYEISQDFADRLMLNSCQNQFFESARMLVYDSGLTFSPQTYSACLEFSVMDPKLDLFRFLVDIKDVYTYPQAELDAIFMAKSRDDFYSLSYGAFENMCNFPHLFTKKTANKVFIEANFFGNEDLIRAIRKSWPNFK